MHLIILEFYRHCHSLGFVLNTKILSIQKIEPDSSNFPVFLFFKTKILGTMTAVMYLFPSFIYSSTTFYDDFEFQTLSEALIFC